MLSDIWKIAKSFVTLADALERYHTEIKDIRQELKDLTLIVHMLVQDIKTSKDQSASDKEKLLLEIENRLLKYDQALSSKQLAAKKSSKPTKKNKKKT